MYGQKNNNITYIHSSIIVFISINISLLGGILDMVSMSNIGLELMLFIIGTQPNLINKFL